MQKISIQDGEIEAKVRKSNRAKCLRLTVNSRAEVIVTVPRLVPMFLVNKFIREKYTWIQKAVDSIKKRQEDDFKFSVKYGSYKKHKEQARSFIKNRVDYFAKKYNFSYNRIAIRNQRSRWGSCSVKRNLNFNFRLLFIDRDLADYVIVHELCHLREMNHSHNFWREVEGILPNWREKRRKLKKVKLY